MAKRKKTATQKESLFNTGAYSSIKTGDFNHAKYDPGWDTGAAFPEVCKKVTDNTGNVSSRKNINAPEVANIATDNTENFSSRKNINTPEVANIATDNTENLSSRNLLNDSDRWDSKNFGEEPPRSIESDGQLTVFFDDSYEAPDPDDYKSIAEYEVAWEQWEQDEARHQQLKTNVLSDSKNLASESYVLKSKRFLEESIQNDASVNSIQSESYVLGNSDIKFLEETTQSNTSVELFSNKTKALVNDEAFLEEEKYKVSQSEIDVLLDTERFQNEIYKAGRQRKGCLHKWIEEKTLKNGIKASYPRIIDGARDPDNVKHWRWAYYWEEKIDGEWRNHSLYVPIGAVSLIIGMQNNYCSVDEIISFIKKSKVKGEKKEKFKAKSDKPSKDKSKTDKKGKGKSKKSNS